MRLRLTSLPVSKHTHGAREAVLEVKNIQSSERTAFRSRSLKGPAAHAYVHELLKHYELVRCPYVGTPSSSGLERDKVSL